MLRGVDLVRTDVSEENISSIIMVESIRDPGTTLAVTSNCSTLRRSSSGGRQRLSLRSASERTETVQSGFTLNMEVIYSFETSALTRATRRHHFSEDRILQCCQVTIPFQPHVEPSLRVTIRSSVPTQAFLFRRSSSSVPQSFLL
jgi:hypothetical protein